MLFGGQSPPYVTIQLTQLGRSSTEDRATSGSHRIHKPGELRKTDEEERTWSLLQDLRMPETE
jgi:hypothetical protein